MLECSVQSFHARPAVWDPLPNGAYTPITYSQLWERIRRVAGQLAAAGVTAKDHVGLLAPSRSWWPIVDFGILSLGAVTVPIYPSLPSNQMAFIIAHSDMCGLVVWDMKQLEKILAIPASAIPRLRFLVLLDDARDAALLDQAAERFEIHFYSEWIEQDAPLPEAAWRTGWQKLTREDMATIVFTSGTTGDPKGVILTHGNILANIEGIRKVIRIDETDQSLSYLPLSHVLERTAGQFVPLSVGASIAYARDFQQILADFQRMPPTVFVTVPRLLEKVLEGAEAKAREMGHAGERMFRWAVDLGARVRVEKTKSAGALLSIADKLVFQKIHQLFGGRLKRIIVGGAPLPKHVGQFFSAAGIPVVEGYGMTETSPVIAVNRPESPVLGTVGPVLGNVEARIAEDGEIQVKGPSITPGYYKNEAATRELFTSDGWLCTGDIGCFTETGELRITDRKKNVIVLSTGKNVTPAPIEGDILKRSVIDQVVLVGHGRKFVSAVVVPNEAVVAEWYRKRGRQVPPRASWARDAELAAFLLAEVQVAVKDYAAFEQPKKIVVAAEPFTVDNGLLTPTLKARAKAVAAAYAEQIDALYGEPNASANLA